MTEIRLLVEGGKAKPDASSAPKLSALKLDINAVFKEINEKTKEFAGMQVPVIIEVDDETKEFRIKVGTPPVSSLVKKELGLEKAKISEEDRKKGITTIADIKMEQVVKIAKMKEADLKGKDFKAKVKQVVGTIQSMQGISIEGKSPKEIIKEIDEGKWDEVIYKDS